jgi:hypothetical protein
VTGVATITGGAGGTRTLAVSGTFSNPVLKATFESPVASEAVLLEGTVAGKTLNGTLTGGGFSGEPIVMTRQ